MREPGLDDLRRYAVARSLFTKTTIAKAIEKLGFLQADPIRAPARAQDLTLRHRVKGYRAGDLERRYPGLAIEEDVLVNYGFVPRSAVALLHPREPRRPWDAATKRRARAVLAFIAARGATHPREVEARFGDGKVRSAWGTMQSASSHLLDAMHYRGLLRVARREGGARIYAAREPVEPAGTAQERARALIDLVVAKYAPLPSPSLGYLAQLLRYGAPGLRAEIGRELVAAKTRLGRVEIDGVAWHWPEGEDPRHARHTVDDDVRLLAPFDPIVWDRRRFELLFGWTYRFEAYTPPQERKLGYYALPLLHRDRVIGWGNVSVLEGRLVTDIGALRGRRVPKRELDEELDRLHVFLRLDHP